MKATADSSSLHVSSLIEIGLTRNSAKNRRRQTESVEVAPI